MTQVYLWSLFAFIATLSGSVLLLVREQWARSNIWRILAFASGVLLGVSFIKILPEATQYAPQLAGFGVLTSFVLIFAIEGFTMMHSCLEFADECAVHHIVGWTAFGALTFHSLIDGMAIAIAFQNNLQLGHAVSSAILVHKITDGLTLTGLLLGTRYSAKKCFKIVALLGFATPLGALMIFPVAGMVPTSVLGWGLGFVAGTFFYVGAADILPRIHKIRDLYCLGAFVIGIVLGGFLPG